MTGVECPTCFSTGLTDLSGGVGECPDCREKRIEKRIDNGIFRTRHGTPIDQPFLDSLHRDKNMSDAIYSLTKSEPKPQLLVGKTGSGKTVYIKKVYNDLLRHYNGYRSKVLYVREAQLFRLFRDEEDTQKFFEMVERRQPEWVFIDDAFQPLNWATRESGRHYATMSHEAMWCFYDWYLYEQSWPTSVMITANQAPEAVLNEAVESDRALIRRVREITGTAKK